MTPFVRTHHAAAHDGHEGARAPPGRLEPGVRGPRGSGPGYPAGLVVREREGHLSVMEHASEILETLTGEGHWQDGVIVGPFGGCRGDRPAP